MEALNKAHAALALGPDMTIVQAAEHHANLTQALAALQDDPRLDLSGVIEFDSSGVQLLLSLRASLAASGQTLQLLEPSAVVCDALSVFGLLEQFPLADDAQVH